MSERLQFENHSLRSQLESLLHEARHNEVKQRRFDLLERRLIAARSFPELLQLLLADYRDAFGIEHVSLLLVDADYEAARLIRSAAEGRLPPGLLLMPDDEALAALYAQYAGTQLCAFEARRHGWLFGHAGDVASVALLPLWRGDELIGSLNLGSAEVERYDPEAGTRFLDRLADVAGICIENALSHERLKFAGLTDALTGVQNRRYFEHRCLAEVSQARRHRHALACMFLDIDRFKRINDTHGHQTGDDVLRGVAEAVQNQLRAGDTIARYGGEEFVVLLPQTAVIHAQEIAERIRVAIAGSRFQSVNAAEVPVTLSIGLSMLDTGCEDDDAGLAAAMIATADRALYDAKHGGRNRVVVATSEAPCRLRRPMSYWGRVARLLKGCVQGLAGSVGRLLRKWLRGQQGQRA